LAHILLEEQKDLLLLAHLKEEKQLMPFDIYLLPTHWTGSLLLCQFTVYVIEQKAADKAETSLTLVQMFHMRIQSIASTKQQEA